MTVQELALTESRSLREQYADRTDVLDRVKALAMLPDSVHVTTDMVARYYEVPFKTIESLVKNNAEELKANGRRVLEGADVREFVTSFDEVTDLALSTKARRLALFSRRAVLNVGQLLRDSEIAKRVRTYLLDVEAIAGPEVRNAAIEAAAVSRAQVLLLKSADGLVDPAWLTSKAKVVIARGLGEEPEIDALDVPLYVPDFIKSKGVPAKRDIESIQSWFGRRVASLYEAEYGEKPGKRQSELPNGQIRETYAWTKRHLPFFEEAWDRWYAAEYTPQGVLDIVEDGAA